jgi:lauroyl/myristoyl acyltransferase
VSDLRHRLTDAAYAGGWALVKALPERLVLRAFYAGADLAARRRGNGVRQLEANLARVVPGLGDEERTALTRAAVRSYARYWCEVFRLSTMSRDRVVGGMQTVGFDGWQEAVAKPEGVILALPHSGNWDQAGAYCGYLGAPFTTVAERLKPESLYDRFVAFRESLGMEVLALGDRTVVSTLRRRLEEGGNLCLMADRDLSKRGIDVQFFGATARFPAGPAALALKTGATLIPVTLAFTDTGWLCTWHDPVPHTDKEAMTQHLADVFAEGIAAHPQDWHMLQKFWIDDLDADDPRRR